jgi:hypothetical protein
MLACALARLRWRPSRQLLAALQAGTSAHGFVGARPRELASLMWALARMAPQQLDTHWLQAAVDASARHWVGTAGERPCWKPVMLLSRFC